MFKRALALVNARLERVDILVVARSARLIAGLELFNGRLIPRNLPFCAFDERCVVWHRVYRDHLVGLSQVQRAVVLIPADVRRGKVGVDLCELHGVASRQALQIGGSAHHCKHWQGKEVDLHLLRFDFSLLIYNYKRQI